MKKIYLLPLLILFITSCGAAKHNVTQKYITEITSNYSQELPGFAEDFSAFWHYVLNNNDSFKKYLSDNSKVKNETSVKFLNQFKDAALPYVSDDAEVVKSEREFAKMVAGSYYTNNLKTISIYPTDEINAFAMPNGAVYVCGGILNLIGDDFDMLMGLVAHEVAHVFLKHAERQTIASLKKEKSNKIVKGITSGLIAGLGAAVVAASINNDTYTEDFGYSVADLAVSSAFAVNYEIDRYAMIKHFEYSREQEVEADIVALLFLEWQGINPEKYISLMSKLPRGGNDNEEYRTHPAMQFRIKSMREFIASR